MPALIDIRRRIRSVKSTQQITKAMKMVSAAKLRRAQDAMFAARPYARKMLEVLHSLASRTDPDAHPLLQERGSDRVAAWSWSPPTRGCAAPSTPTSSARPRASWRTAASAGRSLGLVGRKARDSFKRRAA